MDRGEIGGDVVQRWRMVWQRHRWLIFAVFVTLTGISASAIWLLAEPLYKSTALVHFAPVLSRDDQGAAGGARTCYRDYVNTQAAAILGTKVLQHVIDRESVRETGWFQQHERQAADGRSAMVVQLREALDVRPLRDTELIAVSMRTTRPGDAGQIVNAVVTEYVRMTTVEGGAGDRSLDQMQSKEAELKAGLASLREERYRLSQASALTGSEELNLRLALRLDELQSERRAAEQEIARIDAQRTAAAGEKVKAEDAAPEREKVGAAQQAPTDQSAIEEPTEAGASEWMQLKRALEQRGQVLELRHVDAATPAYFEDNEFRDLQRRFEDSRMELAQARMKWGARHPGRLDAERRVDHAAAKLAARWMELDARSTRSAADAESARQPAVADMPAGATDDRVAQADRLDRERQVQVERLGLIRRHIRELQDQLRSAGTIAHLDEQAHQAQREFEEVHRRLAELETRSPAPARASIESEAVASWEPDSDARVPLTVLSVGAALLTAMAAGYVRWRIDPRIHGATDFSHMIQTPFFGHLPQLPARLRPRELGGMRAPYLFRKGDLPAGTTELMSAESVMLIEEIRTIRTELVERLRELRAQVLLVTGPNAEDGKSSVAMMLARSIATTGRRVLLVDTDLYRPVVGRRGACDGQAGLAALLMRSAEEAQAIHPSDLPGLDILPLGVVPEDFSDELLADGVFGGCIDRWRQSYDVVILDSSPVLATANARILSGHADGTLLVMRASRSHREDVMEAYRRVSGSRAVLMGVVLIGERRTARSAQRYDAYRGAGFDIPASAR